MRNRRRQQHFGDDDESLSYSEQEVDDDVLLRVSEINFAAFITLF